MQTRHRQRKRRPAEKKSLKEKTRRRAEYIRKKNTIHQAIAEWF